MTLIDQDILTELTRETVEWRIKLYPGRTDEYA